MLYRRWLALVPWLAFLAPLMGCESSGSLAFRSISTGGRFEASYPTCVYRPVDGNAADVFLTDLPPEHWNLDSDLSGASGTLVHIHMFLAPRAGSTPLTPTASNMTMRCIVVSRGRVGVYAGGGLFDQDGPPGDDSFSGRLSRASLKLLHADEGFHDALGPCEVGGTVRARRDDTFATILSARAGGLASAHASAERSQR